MSRNKQLSIMGALLLVIGFAIGALTVALMRPPVRVVQSPTMAPPVAQPVAQGAPKDLPPALQPAEPTPAPETKHADTKDVPQSLVEFIRERLEKNTDSGRWEEIEWTHHVGEKEDQRISNLWLPIKVGGHGATLQFRSFNGRVWRRGWIAAAQYAPDHFDWCGEFDGAIVNPAFTMPSEKPIIRNDVELGFKMLDQFITDYEKANPRPAPHVSPSPQSNNP